MNAIIKGMMRDGLRAIVSKDTKIIKLIVRRNDEIDRQYFLLVRLIRSAMLNQRIARKLNLSIRYTRYRAIASHGLKVPVTMSQNFRHQFLNYGEQELEMKSWKQV